MQYGIIKLMFFLSQNFRWFAIVYMVLMFVVLPAFFMGLSFAGTAFVIAGAGIILFIFAVALLVNLLRAKKPSLLPSFLLTWKWLPIWFRSLEPYDRVFSSFSCCKKLKEKSRDPNGNNDTELTASDEKLATVDVNVQPNSVEKGKDNPAFTFTY